MSNARSILDVELEVSGPDDKGFFTANMAWEDLTDAPVDHTPEQSYNRERAMAYALRRLADRLEWRSRNPGKAELVKLGPTELP